ncbi:MAG: hypothetical protein C0498_03245 [Anaerolinea sp.]|nr:hypothetical protein [Anaerolinea sp.]
MAVTAASGDIPRTSPRPAAALIVSWSSLALDGNLALWWLLAGRLLRAGSWSGRRPRGAWTHVSGG